MAVGLSSLPSKTIFFDDNMVLKLGTIECTLSHVLTLHAVTLAQAMEVVEDAPQRSDILLQVRAETFNAFNHQRFAFPDTGSGDGTFGTVTSTTNNFRRMQFGARFQF